MVAVIRKDLMKAQQVAVESEGELVVLKFGNTTVKVHYTLAFQLAQWIRVRGKEAKNRAGDQQRYFNLLGTLTNDPGVTRG